MASTTPSSPQDFPLFPLLPAELRLKIWRRALPGPRVLHLHHNPLINHLVTANRAPSLLYTSYEARVEALRFLKLFFDPRWDEATAATRHFPYVYINPQIDTFYFPILNNRALPSVAVVPPPPPPSLVLPFVPDVLPRTPRTAHILRAQVSDLDNLQLGNSALFPVRHIAFSEYLWTSHFSGAVNTHVFLLEFRELESVTVVVDCKPVLSRKEMSFRELLGEREGTFDVERKEERERVLGRVLLDGIVQRKIGAEGPLERKRILLGLKTGMEGKLMDLKTRDPTWKVPRVEVKLVMRGDWI
ncbi:hypothetical protein VTL71DRAFT_8536 [Oculimacula yallundae]|uniref:2EXR domain-containing protein n=1 Tax=Oculimacula yallundae TaxID=86028 RepID=A0ABR4CY11_9HELO